MMAINFYHNSRAYYDSKVAEGKIDEEALYFVEETDGTFTLYKGSAIVGGRYSEIQSLIEDLQRILDGAPEELDTLLEIANEFTDVKAQVAAIAEALGAHTNNQTNPHRVKFSQILEKPDTLEGYGITDAYTKTEVDEKVDNISHLNLNETHEIRLHLVDGKIGYSIKEKV